MQLVRHFNEPEKSPRAFLKHGRTADTRTLVVCVGDSITHGVVSADYVARLQHTFARDGYAFVNAGLNGNLAYNVLQRLDDVIACHPDVVTLLIGTNDVNATFNAQWTADYIKQQHLPATPTLAWYRENLERILDRLQTETRAAIALLDLPMLGEDLNSVINQRLETYNAAIHAVANARGVSCLPLHARLRAHLPPAHTPPPYTGSKELMGRAILRRLLRRASWDAISRAHGLSVLTDHIHLNDTATAVVAELIGDFLRARQT